MATTVHECRIPLDEISVPENVRSLDDWHVQALAGSIKLQGMLVPLVVRDGGDGFELVAGFHRIAAARSLGPADVPVVIRDYVTVQEAAAVCTRFLYWSSGAFADARAAAGPALLELSPRGA